LLLAWLTTEAVKTQSRELELGDSLERVHGASWTWFRLVGGGAASTD